MPLTYTDIINTAAKAEAVAAGDLPPAEKQTAYADLVLALAGDAPNKVAADLRCNVLLRIAALDAAVAGKQPLNPAQTARALEVAKRVGLLDWCDDDTLIGLEQAIAKLGGKVEREWTVTGATREGDVVSLDFRVVSRFAPKHVHDLQSVEWITETGCGWSTEFDPQVDTVIEILYGVQFNLY